MELNQLHTRENKSQDESQVFLNMTADTSSTFLDLTPGDGADQSLVIANQPRPSPRKTASKSFHSPFNDAHSERDWNSPLCQCSGEQRSCLSLFCCWPVYRYTLATRLGETPFMPLIPCAAFALRIKVRTMFGIKGSIMKDFFTSLFCEPCTICQMMREMDSIGL